MQKELLKQSAYSPSAEFVAVSRAVHQVKDSEPLILRDPLALRIIGARSQQWIRDHLSLFDEERMRRIRSMVTMRSRFCEDELQQAVAKGTRQYVLLGAGLDTFAYRSPEWADGLVTYELDQPATQNWKLERLREAGIGIPSNVRHVGIDFTQDALADVLARSGFDRNAPVFFAWLGVSYYLPWEAIAATLGYVAAHNAGSQIVFDFAVDETCVPPEFHGHFQRLNEAVKRSAEPWKTWFVPEKLLSALGRLGFGEVSYVDAAMAQARYLQGRSDGLLPGPLMGLISARNHASTPLAYAGG